MFVEEETAGSKIVEVENIGMMVADDEMLPSTNCLAVKVGWILFRLLNIVPILVVNSVSLQLMALK